MGAVNIYSVYSSGGSYLGWTRAQANREFFRRCLAAGPGWWVGRTRDGLVEMRAVAGNPSHPPLRLVRYLGALDHVPLP